MERIKLKKGQSLVEGVLEAKISQLLEPYKSKYLSVDEAETLKQNILNLLAVRKSKKQ